MYYSKHVQNLSFNVSDLVRSSSDPIEQRHAQVTICNALRHGRFDESNSMLHMLVYFSRNLIKAVNFDLRHKWGDYICNACMHDQQR